MDTRLPSQRVIRALDELVELRGVLRLDNGLDFINAALRQCAQQHGVVLVRIQPDKPTQNAYIERINRTFRAGMRDRSVFITVEEVCRMTEDWRHRYSHDRPQRLLGGLSPVHDVMASISTSE